MKSREPRRCPTLVPKASSLPIYDSAIPRDLLYAQIDPAGLDLFDDEDWGAGAENEYTVSTVGFLHTTDMYQHAGTVSSHFEGFEPSVFSSDFHRYHNNYGSPTFEPLLQMLSDHHIPAANSMELSKNDRTALDHYQKAFSIYRTTKVPRWSTHRLLLDLASDNPMIMHFILAVSINDVCYRQGNESSEGAKTHFRMAIQDLLPMIRDDSEQDYKLMMAAFLFLYLYIPKQKILPPETVNQ